MDQQSLLRWGLENAAPDSLLPLHADIQAGKRPDLNTDVLKHIMGTSDADRMKECVEVIEGRWVDRQGGGRKDGEVTREDRIRAWDDLEMLVEDLDNANDLQFNKLWQPIVSHLADEDEEISLRACWVCGTAVQNNPKSQSAFLALDPLPTLLALLASRSSSSATRSKAMYCLSSTLKHSEPAVERFTELDGWKSLTSSLEEAPTPPPTLTDPALTLRAKTAFLLSQLILQSTSPASLLTSLRSSSLLPALLASLSPSSALPTGPSGDSDPESIDPDYREKAMRVLINLVESLKSDSVVGEEGKGLSKEEREKVRGIVEGLEEDKAWDVEELGVTKDEWEEFKKAVQ